MDQYRSSNQNTSTANTKVYINRNFNRNGLDNVSTFSNSNVMYFNPNFDHQVSAPHYDQTNRPKIHVNPNFIRPTAPVNTHSNLTKVANYKQVTSTQQIHAVKDNDTQSVTVSKSRYCLVRKNEKDMKPPLAIPVPNNNAQQTIKLNKYKSVSLNSVKKSLTGRSTIAKPIQTTQVKLIQTSLFKTKYKINANPTTSNVQNTRFKYVKRNTITSKSLENITRQSLVRRVSLTHNKSILKTNLQHPKKIGAGAMKKNNIPCPLFKKYGSCLRMLKGSCSFLHDKKHVSICRRFLKGFCHNKQCLLSHDLTDKKMPTCHFYLQGICTKEGCPYLHVKLNEKAKICTDFLKGYCEKGDKCIHRHVNIASKNPSKLITIKKRTSSSSANKRFHIERTKICRKIIKVENNTTRNVVAKCQADLEPAVEQRYFKDLAENVTAEEQCNNMIKPTRCKLGILPSFIQI